MGISSPRMAAVLETLPPPAPTSGGAYSNSHLTIIDKALEVIALVGHNYTVRRETGLALIALLKKDTDLMRTRVGEKTIGANVNAMELLLKQPTCPPKILSALEELVRTHRNAIAELADSFPLEIAFIENAMQPPLHGDAYIPPTPKR